MSQLHMAYAVNVGEKNNATLVYAKAFVMDKLDTAG